MGAAPPALPAEGGVRLLVDDLRALRRRTSLRELAGKAGGRVRGLLLDELALVELVHALDEPVAPPRAATMPVEPIDASSLPALHELNRRRCATRKTRRFASDLAAGCAGWVAFRGGEAVGYYWFADHRAARGHRDLRRIPGSVAPGPGEVYGYDLFLLDEARGGNAAGELLAHVESRLRERGVRRIWGYVEADNRPARWLYATRRYRATRRLATRTLLGYRSTQAGPGERGYVVASGHPGGIHGDDG